MSESEVSQIRDEDVLRRMWQQTEDFSRKKEIRAHMYRLREERLRNLYSPEPSADGKGCEFTSSRGHVKSFADQTFQSMKSKEVRDAGSPPKEFTYRGQDLKELSNAGWSVESEDRTTDDGRTHVKSVNANIEGSYDVEGGRGQFAAVDRQRRALTEHQDERSSTRRDESRSDTAAHDHVVRRSDDGATHSTTTSSSDTSSTVREVTSTRHDAVPYVTDDCDRRHATHDTDRDDRVTRITNRNDYEQVSRRNDRSDAELVSRKVEYPDDNTKVIVETRCLPDGTRVTSTRREFRAPTHTHSTRSESYQTRSERESHSSHRASDTRDSTSKLTRHTTDSRTDDIVDSQRNVDDSDFRRQIRQYTVRDDDDYSNARHNVTKTDRKVSDYSQTEDSQTHYETRIDEKYVDRSTTNREDHMQTQRRTVDRRNDNRVDETDRSQITSTRDRDIQRNVVREIHQVNDVEEKTHNVTSNRRDTEIKVRDTTTTDRTNFEQIRKIPVDEKHPYDICDVPKGVIPRKSQDHPGEDQRPNDRNRNVPKEVEPSSHNIPTEKIITEERIHNITRDTKIEDVVERKTSSDQYQTTYQNDFQTRKVSTDWSPTHQAWASTLRSDTPPTTRPSTRASSPGSKTFKSSTSSLRSSVSPDKTSRKPSSRGGSPNKIDRFSPTRTITSERYSSTHSTHSVNETRTNKTTSPERKPPTGRSPGEPGYSPDRKSNDHRRRPSASPEKRPQSFGEKPYSSPERKPSYKSTGRQPASTSPVDKDGIPRSPAGLRQSPDRKPSSPQRKLTENYSPRSSPSPDRKPVYQKSSNKPSDGPLTSSPRSSVSPDKMSGNVKPLGPRSSPSPDRKPNQSTPTKLSSPYEPENDSDIPDNISKRPSVSPDRKPGYMRPTAASQPDAKRPTKTTEEINTKSPTRDVHRRSPDRLYQDIDQTTTTNIKEDHYRFVDEETKLYSNKDTTNVNENVTTPTKTSIEYRPSQPKDKCSEPNGDDVPDCSIPKKEAIIITENDELYGKVDKTIETTSTTVRKDKQTEDITTKHTPKNKEDPAKKDTPSRETSPTKYGTYDKKKSREVTTVTETKDVTDVKNDSLMRHNKPEPSGMPSSPTKKSPRENTSPTKSATKDLKYKHTTDFITIEKTTEEINKKTTSKDHPRQLITPSSSPTRKPKTTETEPSTGQSSPTTSVSGFVYFGSPRPDKPVVTDLDELYPDSENLEFSKRPDTLDMRRSPSPSKIPCRSPSPEKYVPTTKESLPRKSSLKKPSTDANLTSPIEKPPTNFRVSPSEDKPNLPEHNIIKKDHPQEPETGEPTTVKPKPPLQRRETYEDRCKKILGMVDDTKTESVTKETIRYTKKSRPTQSSPSVLPCDSPAPKESSQFSEFPSKNKVIDNKVDVTDFITREQEHIINTTITPKNKPRTPSRESSPTKLQDITRKTTLTTTKKTTEAGDEYTVTTTNTTKNISSRQSSDKSPQNKRPSESPERKNIHELPKKSTTGQRDTSPIKSRPTESPSPRSSLSPGRKYTQDKSPQRESPGRSHHLTKITTSATSRHDATSTTDVQEMTHVRKTSKSPPRRVLESPTRQIPKPQNFPEKSTKQPHTTSPSKSYPRDGSPDIHHQPKSKQVKPDGSRPEDIGPNKPVLVPGYMKTTEAVTSKFESATTEDIKESHILKTTIKNEPKALSQTQRSTSPTKQESFDRPDSSPHRKSSTKEQSQPSKVHSRTPSPTKQSRPADLSPTRKNSKHEPGSFNKQPRDLSPTRQEPANIPGYMKSTITSSSKIDRTNDEREVVEETNISITEEQDDYSSEELDNTKIPGYMKSTITSSIKFDKNDDERENIQEKITSTFEEKIVSPRDSKSHIQKPPKPTEDSISKPCDNNTVEKPHIPGYMKTTTSVAYKYDAISTEDSEVNTIHDKYTFSTTKSPVQDSPKTGGYPHPVSSLTPTEKSSRKSSTSPNRKPTFSSPEKDDTMTEIKDSPLRSSISPDRPSYMKPTASVISKYDALSTTTQDTQEIVDQNKTSARRLSSSPGSPSRISPEREPKDVTSPEEQRQLRTPSPIKKASKITEVSTDFILSEKEQEILNKVQKSLRKLSPDRKEKSPSRERSPSKSTTSLQDIDIVTKETLETKEFINRNLSEISEEQTPKTPGKPKQPAENKAQIKPSRTVSPTKKVPKTTPNKLDKNPESPKSRSISPKKPVSYIERPQSPQIPKTSGIKPREQIPGHLTRKPTPATLATTKIEKLTSETKKTNGITKQNVFNRTTISKTVSKSTASPTRKPSEPETKRPSPQKALKENVSPKKDIVTRTTSEIAMKPKKTASPQRMRSKPEIQVSDMSTKTPKSQKPLIKEPQIKLPNKPKSATALNTSTDDDDIIIDVQQSKSSRENSPDRICPTPINFNDDVGTPRFPDEVSEPDDEFVKRTHNIIHETETVVDDIVEICEDEELFVQKPKRDNVPEGDDSILSVTEKVNKFTNKVHSTTKPKNTTTSFKHTEKRVHSDLLNENLKSDECLLTVSEKVTKFAKGPRDTKDNRSPSRKITDEYDRDTIYQDDYTKLSVNDKAHLFVETAENIKVPKVKPTQRVERPDLSNVDESLKSDDCLLSVSDKVNKFVKTAENIITDTHSTESSNKNIQESHKQITRQITIDDDDDDDETFDRHEIINPQPETRVRPEVKSSLNSKEPKLSQPKPKVKEYDSPTSKPTERTPTVKITTLRSSEAVKKAKALFENIAQTKETTHTAKTSTKLTDIGVIKKSPKTDSTTALHPSIGDTPSVADVDSELDTPLTRRRPSSGTSAKPQYSHAEDRSSPTRLTAESPEVPRMKSPMRQSVEITTTKTVLSRYSAPKRAESPRNRAESPLQRTESPRQRTESPRQRTESPRMRPESDKTDKVPGYLRPTMTSQIKEEPKIIEEPEVSSRRGSGKFGVELRRTSVDRSTVSSERRRSVEHHQPCIEDIYDLDLLEQMLEKVTGYEQRRRIRAQIRVARNQSVHSNVYTKTTKTTTTVSKTRSPERTPAKSPERAPKAAPQKTLSPDRLGKGTPQKTIPDRHQQKESTPLTNGHSKTPTTRQRPRSPEKSEQKSSLAPKSPVRQPSPDKRRPLSPNKATATSTSRPKGNRFNEYASAYMKKVGLDESEKVKFTESKTKKTTAAKQTVKHEREDIVQEFTTTKTFSERNSSRDIIEIVQNGKRSPSPGKKQSPERKAKISEKKAQSPERKAHSPSRKVHSPERHVQSPDRLYQRTPSPDFKRPKAETVKETVIKTVYDIEKKIPSKSVQDEKPSWVTNRNLKKITTESRTYSTKKIENEKPKYRAASPSKVISKPTDVITSSYGPGPLDADGRPLFGIKALRNGATNFQVKGTVIRQEFHSRNGGEPEGTVSVTAYSSQPEELEQLLASQGVEPPSRLHGLSAITTTKKFGGDTGNSLSNVHTKEERASLEHFTHTDRKTDSRVENLDTRTYDRIEDVSSRKTDSRNDRLSDKSRTVKKEEKSTEIRKGSVEERRERVERREDKKTVRQSSVKSLTEKYIKSTNDSSKSDRTSYPKAGLILRTTSMRDSVSSDDAHPGLTRGESDHSLGSGEDTVVTTTERTGDGVRTTTTTRTTHHGPTVTRTVHEPTITKRTTTVLAQEPLITKKTSYVTQEPKVTRHGTTTVTTERSFLDSNSKVTGVQDILTRMKNADIVIQEGDTAEDTEARALLNKFLGATVLMAGMQGYVADQPEGRVTVRQETVRSTGSGGKVTSSSSIQEVDIDHCWDERLLKKLLDECTDYEQRRRLRARIRTLMAEQEACASAVTEALGAAGAGGGTEAADDAREEEEVTVTSSVRRDSSDKTVSSSTTTTKTSKVIEMTRSAPKPVSPFAKFRQLEKQNSTNSPNSPKSPQSPGSPSQPYFKFTDPALQCSALTIKERLLQWCRDKTRDYENVKLENFSTSWADGLAFCALVHHFLPHTFDYSKLTPERRRHNFTLAFKVADEKAGIYPLLDVDDMVAMRKPDWKCVFTYVQAIYRRFKDQD